MTWLNKMEPPSSGLAELRTLADKKCQDAAAWTAALDAFMLKNRTTFTFNPPLVDADKLKFFEFIIPIVRSNQDWSIEAKCLVLDTIKVIMRSRTSLNFLFRQDTVRTLFDIVKTHKDDKAADKIKYVDLAIMNLINLCVLDHPVILPMICQDAVFFSAIVSMFQSSLTVGKRRMLVCRLLFFISTDEQLANRLAAENFYTALHDQFMHITSQQNYLDDPDTLSSVCDILKTMFSLSTDSKRLATAGNLSKDFQSFAMRMRDIISLPMKVPANSEIFTSGDPPSPSLHAIKLNLFNLWLYAPDVTYDMLTDEKAMHGAVELLEAQCRFEKNEEGSLVPLLTVFNKASQANVKVRKGFKEAIFRELANPPDRDDEDEEEKKKEPSVEAPKGKDDETNVIKRKLLSCMTSFHFSVKVVVSEFLFNLCGQDSGEFIRLTGFGNAVGLLAEKGLPGFAMLKSQSIDLDKLVEAKKQRMRESGYKDLTDEELEKLLMNPEKADAKKQEDKTKVKEEEKKKEEGKKGDKKESEKKVEKKDEHKK